MFYLRACCGLSSAGNGNKKETHSFLTIVIFLTACPDEYVNLMESCDEYDNRYS